MKWEDKMGLDCFESGWETDVICRSKMEAYVMATPQSGFHRMGIRENTYLWKKLTSD